MAWKVCLAKKFRLIYKMKAIQVFKQIYLAHWFDVFI